MAEKKSTILLLAKDQATKTLNKLGSVLGKVTSAATKLAKVGFAGLSVALGVSVKNANDQNRVLAQMDAVLQSTNGAVNLTKKEIVDLSQALQEQTGVGDEVIQSGQNLLLTFTNLKDDAFKGATEALLDMTFAMNNGNVTQENLKQQAIQLGKALNDPIAGISALSRTGIQFNEEQKETIKNLVQMGDVSGAQAIILKELNTQFGGAASSLDNYDGKTRKLWGRLGDLSERVGDEVIPILEDHFLPVVDSIITTFEKLAESGALSEFFLNLKLWLIDIEKITRLSMLQVERIIKRPFSFSTYKPVMGLSLKGIKGFFKSLSDRSNKWAEDWANNRNTVTDVEEQFQERLQDILDDANEERERTIKRHNDNVERNQKKFQEITVKNQKQTNKELQKENEKHIDETKKQSEDLTEDLVEIGKDFADDFNKGVGSAVNTFLVGENGFMSFIQSGLNNIMPGVGQAIGGSIGGFVTDLFGNIFGKKDKRSFDEIWKGHLEKLRDKADSVLNRIGEKKSVEEEKVDLLEELRDVQGGDAALADRFLPFIGVQKGATIDEALVKVKEALKSLTGQEVQSVIDETNELQRQADIARAFIDKRTLENERGPLGKNNLSDAQEKALEESIADVESRFGKIDISRKATGLIRDVLPVGVIGRGVVKNNEVEAGIVAIEKRLAEVRKDLAKQSEFQIQKEIERVRLQKDIADILGVAPTFSRGGIVPGNSMTGDNVMIRANSGERVLTSQTNQELHNLLAKLSNSLNMNSGNVVEIKLMLDKKVLSREIINLTKQREAGLL